MAERSDSIKLTSLKTVGDSPTGDDSNFKNTVIDIPSYDDVTFSTSKSKSKYELPPYNGITNQGFEPNLDDNLTHNKLHPRHPEDVDPNHVVDIKDLSEPTDAEPGDDNLDNNWMMKKSDLADATLLDEVGGPSTSTSSIAKISEPGEEEQGCWSQSVTNAQASVSEFFSKHGKTVRHVIYGIILAGYGAYFAWSLNYEFGTESSIRLLWMTLVAMGFVIITLVRDNFGDVIYEKVLMPPVGFVRRHFKIFKWCFISAVIAGVILFLGLDVGRKRPGNLISLVGYAAYILLLFLLSSNPAKVKWRPVCWGLGMQFCFALIVLRTKGGYNAFKWLGDRVSEFMEYSDEGAIFIFGENFTDHFFAFKVMPIVIFFSATISILYYLGTMQTIIGKIAWVMQRTLGTTAAESVNAAGNIFIGQTEAPLLIRPMINDMTKSELHAVMTGGYATIAGSVMATYISIGVPAQHLISASIMAAPCALAMSKLFYPETEKSKTTGDAVSKMEKSPQRNIIEAASAGASGAIGLVANIVVNLMAFISLLAFLNTVLTWMGHRAGMWPPDYPELTFQLVCSYVLWPFAFIMGVDQSDCRQVAELIGIKTFINEFVAYQKLGVLIENSDEFSTYNGTVVYTQDDMFLVDRNVTLIGGIMEDRSTAIATYALCGFANIGSLGTVMGALGSMAPHRKSEISSLALRAMIAGTVVSFMNACTAGLLYQPEL